MKKASLLIALVVVSACGGKDASPTSPAASAQPASTFSLSGIVTGAGGTGLAGATVLIADGVNGGRAAATDTAGNYNFTSVTPSAFTLNASASGYAPQNKAVNLTANTAVSFALVKIVPLFVKAGVGDTVFNLPAGISRITVTGDYAASSSNFIVHCDGFSGFNVNELMGTHWGQTHFEGTYLTRGCIVVEILSSSGVSWSFTEVR